jgi:hypothetical protein
MDVNVPIYIGVPRGNLSAVRESVDRAVALGMKVDRVDASVGAIHGSGPPGLIERLRSNGLVASPVKKLSFDV